MGEPENTGVCKKQVFPENIPQVLAESQGYTMIELIMVIVLLSILAVSALPKFTDTSVFSVEGAAAMVAADIRYAQELAMSSNDDKKVDFTQDSSTYTLKNSDDSVFRTVELPSGVTVSSPSVIFTFSSLGEPTTGGGSSVEIQAGSSTKTITVDSYTGRVSSS